MAGIPMSPVTPVMPIALDPFSASQLPMVPSRSSVDFNRLLTEGAQAVSNDVINADNFVREFTINDAVPVHQVTFALEQARLSLNLMMQVRNRLVEGYQQMMNMQL